jgi:plastocyanin
LGVPLRDNGAVRYFFPCTALVVLAACGGGNATPAGPSTGTSAATITITSSGVSPTQVTVSQGSRVMFVNNDTRSHDMESDPHPEHTDCPEINVGLLQPGQSRETLNLVTARTCGFHDHNDPPPGGARWTGRITVQ